jgi:hypothetical protein
MGRHLAAVRGSGGGQGRFLEVPEGVIFQTPHEINTMISFIIIGLIF